METAVQITVALSIAVLVNALTAEMLMVATVEMPTAETKPACHNRCGAHA